MHIEDKEEYFGPWALVRPMQPGAQLTMMIQWHSTLSASMKSLSLQGLVYLIVSQKGVPVLCSPFPSPANEPPKHYGF
jgi:hypothetical protein